MTTREDHQAQREAVAAQRREPSSRRHREHDEAVQKYLRMQDLQRRDAETRARTAGAGTPAPAHGEHGHGPLRHLHLSVDGHGFDVTEDDVGVVELHQS